MLNRREIAFECPDIPELGTGTVPDDRCSRPELHDHHMFLLAGVFKSKGEWRPAVPYRIHTGDYLGYMEMSECKIIDPVAQRLRPDPCKISDIEFTDAVAKNSLSA